VFEQHVQAQTKPGGASPLVYGPQNFPYSN